MKVFRLWTELGILGAIILLRGVLTILIHLEIKNEEEALEKSHAPYDHKNPLSLSGLSGFFMRGVLPPLFMLTLYCHFVTDIRYNLSGIICLVLSSGIIQEEKEHPGWTVSPVQA